MTSSATVTELHTCLGTLRDVSRVLGSFGLRPDPDAEELGLDSAHHGEVGYRYEEGGA
jgi:hypothetical protein